MTDARPRAEILASIHELQGKLAGRIVELAESQEVRDDLSTDNARYQTEIARLRSQSEAWQAHATAAIREVAALKSELARTQAALTGLRGEIAEERAERLNSLLDD